MVDKKQELYDVLKKVNEPMTLTELRKRTSAEDHHTIKELLEDMSDVKKVDEGYKFKV